MRYFRTTTPNCKEIIRNLVPTRARGCAEIIRSLVPARARGCAKDVLGLVPARARGYEKTVLGQVPARALECAKSALGLVPARARGRENRYGDQKGAKEQPLVPLAARAAGLEKGVLVPPVARALPGIAIVPYGPAVDIPIPSSGLIGSALPFSTSSFTIYQRSYT